MKRTFKKLEVLFAIAAFVSAIGGTCLAQGQEMDIDQTLMQGNCAKDAKQYCSDITTGHGRLAACLKAHDDKISTDCMKDLQQLMTEMSEIQMECRTDIRKYCGSVHQGSGNIINCLRDHMDELSTICKTAITALPTPTPAPTPTTTGTH